MTHNRGKVAWLIIGGIFFLGIIANGIGKSAAQQKESKSIWKSLSPTENVSETEVTSGDKNKIAVIKVDGEIIDSASEPGSILATATGASASQLVKQIDRAEEDPNVKALILQINSPGGTAVAGQTITERLGKFRSSGKKLYVSMREVAASAAYEISTPADKIFANPETMTGSIGVIMQLTNYQGLYDKIGLSDVTIKSGAEKDIGNPARPMTDVDRAILQAMVDESYNNFVATVAKWRKLDEQKVRDLADGRVYTAKQALGNGLIDELGNMPAVIEHAKKESALANPTVVEYGSGALGGIFGTLFQKVAAANNLSSLLTSGSEHISPGNKLMHKWIP